MKKIPYPLTLIISIILLTSCSHFKRSTKMKDSEVANLTEVVEVEDTVGHVVAKNDEYTHEMAEANANDDEITQKVGTADIDEDENKEVSKPLKKYKFLQPKKTKRMEFWVDYFTNKQRERFQRFINNGEEYRHHVEEILASYGLPKELYFVGLIESGYYLSAKSHASAVGPWQFIRATGKRYGLKITNEVDERKDLFKATHSAAQYFKDLYNIFSSWELSLSAYNAGEYGIIRRIMKHGTRDFYKLSKNKQLPTETINYVPKVLAAMHVLNNAQKYGFVLPKKEQKLFDHTELMAVKKNQSLNSIANRLGVSAHLLKKLNPELKTNSTPRYFAGVYQLRVPSSTKKSFPLETVLASEEADSSSAPITIHAINHKRKATSRPTFHRVRKGETLISISRKYETSPKKLAKVNHFASWKTKVRVGQKIKLEEQVISTSQASSKKIRITSNPITYKVRKGDNLHQIAKMFKTQVNKIKKTNALKKNQVKVGQKLVIPGTQKGIYTVQKGDQLHNVAKEFNQSAELIAKLNDMRTRNLKPGQKIIVNID